MLDVDSLLQKRRNSQQVLVQKRRSIESIGMEVRPWGKDSRNASAEGGVSFGRDRIDDENFKTVVDIRSVRESFV